MGFYEKGILGPFEGKVGTVVGSTWKGKPYMKSKNKKSKKPATEAQVQQHAKFALVTAFVATLGKLFMNTFKYASAGMTGRNSAFSDIFENAVTGTYPDFALDYSKVLISKGSLHNATGATASAIANSGVKFDWTDNSSGTLAYPTDRSILVIHCPEMKRSLYTETGATRSAGTENIDASVFAGKVVHTWIGFITSNGKEIASSMYTGSVTVSGS